MTREQIDQLSAAIGQQEQVHPRLIETHISWVILAHIYAYKIKKPVHFSFLDFSHCEKRKYYCEQEITLNNRLTENIYIDVQPILANGGGYRLGAGEGKIIDYAVKMMKVDEALQMDILLKNNKVTPAHIHQLAEKIAQFHKYTTKIFGIDPFELQQQFNDIENEKQYLSNHLQPADYAIIDKAIQRSDLFIKEHACLLQERMRKGCCRDCHGDLHTGNIFLLPDPQPFDCIEFNDSFRQIDILNEIAFLCMDLEAAGRQDLATLFVNDYNDCFPVVISPEEKKLFVYYKIYRANVRAKVNSLKAANAENEVTKNEHLLQTVKYLRLMENYLTGDLI